MRIDPIVRRNIRALVLAAGLAFCAAGASAQSPMGRSPMISSGVSFDPPPAEQRDPRSDDLAEEAEAPSRSARSRPARTRSRIQPYLEVSQVVSSELDGGDTLTYTSVAAGIDGRIETRRVTIQASYRYQRNIEWEGDLADRDEHSGIAMVNAQLVPGVLQIEAGALATRTAGEGRALGVTDRDGSVEVYAGYAGPTLSTHAGPVEVNAAYRLGYVKVDDDQLGGPARSEYDSGISHNVSASVGMAPGQYPVGWTVGGGYVRSESNNDFEDEFEGAYVRADVVVPVGPTFALTAGVGYEDIEASQNGFALDGNGNVIIDDDGGPVADPSRPRVLTYQIDGMIYDAGLIWRPSARTELQARVGRRYGGTTFVGSLTHQIDTNTAVNAVLFDTVETFSNLLTSDLSGLPDNFTANTDPLTGNLGGCVFGADPGSGICLTRALQSIRGGTFRMRGASIIVSGGRGLWDWGVGAGYAHRRYGQPQDPDFDLFGPSQDDSITLYASLGRQLSRTSDLGLDAYASWYDTNEAAVDRVFTAGAKDPLPARHHRR